jgi:extracellular factor (EF) 3-hydroxypalmitic acid methyl ester biosynthesis protein
MEKNTAGTAALNDNWVVFQTSQGAEVRASLVRVTRHLAVLEIYTPSVVLQVSEVLGDFKIYANEEPVYSGRAVVQALIYTGTSIVCEAALEDSWEELEIISSVPTGAKLRTAFTNFLQASQSEFRILPELKLAVADLQIFLLKMRKWLEQVELAIRSQPQGARVQLERNVLDELQKPMLSNLTGLFERIEHALRVLDPDLRLPHSAYLKNQLHPLVLCAPFMYRTFKKPLGYAGDYEMVDMMMRDPYEGGSLFAKMLNTYFLNIPPAVAHRNRITYLIERLEHAAIRAAQAGRIARIYNLGCGPAKEIQDFFRASPLCEHTQFTLLDFNDETLQYTGKILTECKTKYHRQTPVRLLKKSVAQVLKDAAKAGSVGKEYDLVYCAGLFDYLPDQICERLSNIFYDMLSPGGLLIMTNVEASNPSRGWMDSAVEWHLIYRDTKGFAKCVPRKAPVGSWAVLSDATGVNLFLEVRKPDDA